jgi:hypothetical protein
MAIEEQIEDTSNIKGHVVNTKKRYKRDIDEEAELKDLIAQRNALTQEQEEIKADEEENETLDAEELTFKKRYGDLRRHNQRVQDEHKKQIKKLQSQINDLTKKSVNLPKSETEIAEWSKKYPDVAKMMESIAIKKSGEMSDDLQKEMKELQEMRKNVVREKAESELKTFHPDYDQIRKDPAFHEWASVQPKWVQEALYENDTDAYGCAKAITLYKAERKATKKTATPTNAADNVAVKGTPKADTGANKKGGFRESDVQKMTGREYEANEEAITASIRNGTFIYDISGAAM